MNLPEAVVAEQIDAILKRAALRIAIQRQRFEKLSAEDPQTSKAQRELNDAVFTFERLSEYRAGLA